jgi:hypothetical protein
VSAKPETLFSNNIRKALPEEIYSMKNNNEYVAGVADVWFSGQKNDLWIEFKFLKKLPVRAPIRPYELLSPLQSQWLRDRHNEGRNVAVVIGCKRKREYEGIILRNLEWERDIFPQDFDALIVSKSELVSFIKEQVM